MTLNQLRKKAKKTTTEFFTSFIRLQSTCTMAEVGGVWTNRVREDPAGFTVAVLERIDRDNRARPWAPYRIVIMNLNTKRDSALSKALVEHDWILGPTYYGNSTVTTFFLKNK